MTEDIRWKQRFDNYGNLTARAYVEFSRRSAQEV